MQNGVTISTNDSELNIVYGMMDLRKERELARASVRYILTDLNDIRKQYIRLGFHLHEFSVSKYYEDFGFATLEEFCAVNFGLDKSTVSRCIDVWWEYAASSNLILPPENRRSNMEIDDRWNMYSYSQLVEMLPLTDEQRLQIKPEMSIRQIREYKKSLKKKKEPEAVATSQQGVVYSDIYCSGLFGAAKYNYYKKINGKLILVEIVDANGKPVDGFYHIFADALNVEDDHVLIRLYTVRDDKSKEESGA